MEDYPQGMHPNSLKNLLPKPPQGAQRKGGIARKKQEIKRKQIRDIVEYLINLPVNEGKVDKIKNIMEAKSRNLTVVEMMTIAQIKKAFTGDTKAFEAVTNILRENSGFDKSFDADGRETVNSKIISALMERPVQGDNDNE